jgi:uncharacterized protein YejL (UPF0352 family)
LTKLAEAQKRLADRTTDDVIKDQYTVATQSLNSINAILLTLGNMAKNGIDNSSVYKSVLEKVKASNKSLDQMTPEEITNLYNSTMDEKVNPFLTKLINASETALDKGVEMYNNSGIKEPVEKVLESVKDGASKGYDAVKEIVTKLVVSVDINSSSTELTGMVVNEINRNPQLRSDLASNMVKSMKDYVG